MFEDNLRRSLMIDKLRAALTDWMTVADADVEREFKERNEKVKLQVVALTADRVPRPGHRHATPTSRRTTRCTRPTTASASSAR